MAGCGNVVVNLGPIPRGVMAPPGCPPEGWLRPNIDNVDVANTNATNLQRVSQRLHDEGGGTIIVPERYYLGKPVREMLPDASRSTP